MKYELFLNANNGAYSDRIGTFNTLEELNKNAQDVTKKQLYNFDADKDNLTAVEISADGEERFFDIEIF